MIQIELNGKTRLISIDELLERDMQDILADDYGSEDEDPLSDFCSTMSDEDLSK